MKKEIDLDKLDEVSGGCRKCRCSNNGNNNNNGMMQMMMMTLLMGGQGRSRRR